MAEFLDIHKIERAFDALFSAGILSIKEDAKEDLPYPIDKEDYISVCAEFTFNAFNIGLREAAIYFEKSPDGSAGGAEAAPVLPGYTCFFESIRWCCQSVAGLLPG